jgi:hypothetical protein
MMSGKDTTSTSTSTNCWTNRPNIPVGDKAVATSGSIRVRIRSTKSKGGTSTAFDCPIADRTSGLLKQLKEGVATHLNTMYWSRRGRGVFALNSDHIKIYASGEDVAEVTSDGDLASEVASKKDVEKEPYPKQTFVALEIFTTALPEDLFRTVARDQLHRPPTTLARHKNAWTAVAPLYCAGFTEDEEKKPWLEIKGTGDFKVHGVSLRLWDYENDEIDVSLSPNQMQVPLGDIQENDQKTGFFRLSLEGMTLEDLQARVPGYKSYDQTKGILHSTITRRGDERGFRSLGRRIESKKNSKTIFFRFKLQNTENLSPYNVAAVFDNSSARHVSLVLLGESSVPSEWFPRNQTQDVLVPPSCVDLSKDDAHTNMFESSCSSDYNHVRLCQDWPYACLPMVAASFQFHDIKIEAKAEPPPPCVDSSHPENSEKMKIYDGAVALLHHDIDWPVMQALDALHERAKCVVKNLDRSSRDTLLDFLNGEPDMTPALDMLADRNERRVREGPALDPLPDWSEQRVREGLAAFHTALKN